jgi:hypothetical protein
LLYYFANETAVTTRQVCGGDVPKLFGVACRGNKPNMAKYFVFLLFASQEKRGKFISSL